MEQVTLYDESGAFRITIPAGRRVCPTCHGQGVVGTIAENRDPQTVESTDCPTCDPHDGSASLGHITARRG